jgi:hypothetical protein
LTCVPRTGTDEIGEQDVRGRVESVFSLPSLGVPQQEVQKKTQLMDSMNAREGLWRPEWHGRNCLGLGNPFDERQEVVGMGTQPGKVQAKGP